MPEHPRTADRDETHAEKMDRNWSDLLQELRVTQTGAQILTAFLVSLPFQQRFTRISSWERDVYLATVGAATLSTLFLVTPVAVHRALFRRHDKQALVVAGDRLARAGLSMLGLGVTGSVALISGVVLGAAAAVTATALVVAVTITLWVLLPLHLRAGSGRDGSADAPAGAAR